MAVRHLIFLLLSPLLAFAQVDTLGNTTEQLFNNVGGAGFSYANLYTATTTFTLSGASVYFNAAVDATVKLSLYLDDGDNTPDAGDTFVGASTEIASGSSTGFKTGTFSSGTVTAGSVYWLIATVKPTSANSWTLRYYPTNPFVNFYKAASGVYSDPSSLPNTWTEQANRQFLMYATGLRVIENVAVIKPGYAGWRQQKLHKKHKSF